MINKMITFIRNNKLIFPLIFILLVLVILKIALKSEPVEQGQKKTPALEKEEKEYPPPEELPSPSTSLFKDEQKEEGEGKEIQIPYDPAGEALEQALEERPWLLDLPIEGQNYNIAYLGEEKGFRVLMRIDITSPLSREQQIANIKAQTPEKLKAIGVDLNKEKVFYTFTP